MWQIEYFYIFANFLFYESVNIRGENLFYLPTSLGKQGNAGFGLCDVQRKQWTTQRCPKGIQLSPLIFSRRKSDRPNAGQYFIESLSFQSTLPSPPPSHISPLPHFANNRHAAKPVDPPNWRSRQRAASTSTESNRTGGTSVLRPATLRPVPVTALSSSEGGFGCLPRMSAQPAAHFDL